MDVIFVILIAVAALILGVAGGYFVFHSFDIAGKRKKALAEAEREAEVIKEKKLLEVK
jgi:ribonuclease Y